MRYSILHKTRIRYSHSVRESVMEVRKRPLSRDGQSCLLYELHVLPTPSILSYIDPFGNDVRHFAQPREHAEVAVKSRAVVDVQVGPPLPFALDRDDWTRLDELVASEGHWDVLQPSRYIPSTPLLDELVTEFDARRRDDPLSLLKELRHRVFTTFEFKPQATRVDSPIDDALEKRQGVCQDLAHILIALCRRVGIPARYVSGYLYAEIDEQDQSGEDSTHAWVECLLPELGWVGIDPTNDSLVGDRHIAIAIGRDYADVPPTRGAFKGSADSEIAVAVRVALHDAPQSDEPVWRLREAASTDLVSVTPDLVAK